MEEYEEIIVVRVVIRSKDPKKIRQEHDVMIGHLEEHLYNAGYEKIRVEDRLLLKREEWSVVEAITHLEPDVETS